MFESQIVCILLLSRKKLSCGYGKIATRAMKLQVLVIFEAWSRVHLADFNQLPRRTRTLFSTAHSDGFTIKNFQSYLSQNLVKKGWKTNSEAGGEHHKADKAHAHNCQNLFRASQTRARSLDHHFHQFVLSKQWFVYVLFLTSHVKDLKQAS